MTCDNVIFDVRIMNFQHFLNLFNRTSWENTVDTPLVCLAASPIEFQFSEQIPSRDDAHASAVISEFQTQLRNVCSVRSFICKVGCCRSTSGSCIVDKASTLEIYTAEHHERMPLRFSSDSTEY